MKRPLNPTKENAERDDTSPVDSPRVPADDGDDVGRHHHTRRIARLIIWSSVVGVVLAVFGLAAWELHRPGGAGASGVTVADYKAEARVDGRQAPSFSLPRLDGSGNISLQQYAGRVVVVNFWASWCGPCRDEAPDLESAWTSLRKEGVQFLGIDYRDDRPAAQAFEREFHITYPSVFDPSGRLAFDFKLIGLPTTFIIDPRGRISYQFVGRVDPAALTSAVSDTLHPTTGSP